MAYNVYLMSGLPISSPLSPIILQPKVILDCQRTLQGYFDKIVRAHDTMKRICSTRLQYGRAA
jgi:hypothetical protein